MHTFDIPQLIALATVLGFASGIRLYAVLLIAGLVGYAGWVELPGGLAILQHPWVARRVRCDVRSRVCRRQDSGCRHRLGLDSNLRSNSRRRSIGSGRVRRNGQRRVDDRCRDCRWIAGSDQPLHEGGHTRGREHITRTVFQHRPVGRRRHRHCGLDVARTQLSVRLRSAS